jgi:glycosyltransferase involved in cell wall biosynthesis
MDEQLTVGGFLRNASVADVDLRHPEDGNPGVGGTHFGFVSLAYYLKQYRGEDVNPVLYAQSTENLPESVGVVEAPTPVEAVRKAAANGCDMFLIRIVEEDSPQNILEVASAVGLPILIWAHNFPSPELLDEAASRAIVRRIICVGQEELDRHRDHPAFYKSQRIFNGIDPDVFAPSSHIAGQGDTVVYLGSLHQGKGFHKLARVWPKIRHRVSGAKLVVIGSGTLYDRSAKLGKWGVASEKYEQRFRQHLSGPNGDPHPCVTFRGNMGTEKIPLLQNADVGVANPTGDTETFCLGAVEFQASGTPVVSAAEGGLLDTVRDGETGLLIQSDKELVDAIVRLLQNRELRQQFGQEGLRFVRNTFAYEIICDEWVRLFRNVAEGTSPKPQPVQQNLFYQYKWLRESMRLIKCHIPFLERVPSLIVLSKALRRLRDKINS